MRRSPDSMSAFRAPAFKSGLSETHSISELLDVAFATVGIDDWKPYVQTDTALLRPAEVDQLIGDATKARNALGWKPKVTFKDLVEMMVHNDLALQSRDAGHAAP